MRPWHPRTLHCIGSALNAPRLLAASLFAATAGRAAQATDPSAVVAAVRAAADAADKQLVDQRLAVWASLKARRGRADVTST
jgi:hypothetical protein